MQESPTSTRGPLRIVPQAPKSYPVGKHSTKLSITNNAPAEGVKHIIRVRWGIPVMYVGEPPTEWTSDPQ
jgi:hypothetical protein